MEGLDSRDPDVRRDTWKKADMCVAIDERITIVVVYAYSCIYS